MTEQEILAQLRDIHLPAELSVHSSYSLNGWPLVLLAALLVIMLGMRIWQRNLWRRQARAELRRIEACYRDHPQAYGQALITLAVRMARTTGQRDLLSQAVWQPPQTVTAEQSQELASRLRRVLGV